MCVCACACLCVYMCVCACECACVCELRVQANMRMSVFGKNSLSNTISSDDRRIMDDHKSPQSIHITLIKALIELKEAVRYKGWEHLYVDGTQVHTREVHMMP